MNTFVENNVTMITQLPVIINVTFTQQLTIEGSPELDQVRDDLVIGLDNAVVVYLCQWNNTWVPISENAYNNTLCQSKNISEPISEYMYYNNRLRISVERIRTMYEYNGKNPTTIRVFVRIF